MKSCAPSCAKRNKNSKQLKSKPKRANLATTPPEDSAGAAVRVVLVKAAAVPADSVPAGQGRVAPAISAQIKSRNSKSAWKKCANRPVIAIRRAEAPTPAVPRVADPTDETAAEDKTDEAPMPGLRKVEDRKVKLTVEGKTVEAPLPEVPTISPATVLAHRAWERWAICLPSNCSRFAQRLRHCART